MLHNDARACVRAKSAWDFLFSVRLVRSFAYARYRVEAQHQSRAGVRYKPVLTNAGLL